MTSECERVVPLLGPMFDGRLQAPVRGALVAHVRECSDCLAVARDLKRLALEANRMAKQARAPADLAARVRASIEARRPDAFSASRVQRGWRRAPPGVRFAVGVVAAACVFAAVFVAGYARGRAAASSSDPRGTPDPLPHFAFDGAPESAPAQPTFVVGLPTALPAAQSPAQAGRPATKPLPADELMRAWLAELERQGFFIGPRVDAGSSPPRR
ncbi:MAG: hypothetical protein JNL94_06160 [Planctomycetes bacterium]|nr:hypothetical protein [Planctomycetota bacterium]